MSRTASSAEPVSIVVPAELQGPLLDFLNAFTNKFHGMSPPPSNSTTSSNNWQRLPTISFLPQCKPLLKNLLRSESRAGRDSRSLVPLPGCVFLCQPKAFKNQGRRTVSVRLSRGSAISIRVVYYSRKCDRRPTSRARRLLPRPWNALGSSIAGPQPAMITPP